MNRSEITLLENETLIWGQSKKKNLLSLRYVVPIIIFALNLIILIATVWVIMIDFFWVSFIFVFLMVIGTCYFIWITMNYVKTLRKNLKLSDDKLKNYEYFDIITNQRYIRRSYFLNFYKDYSIYPKDVLEIEDDVFFLNLKSVRRILFLLRRSTIAIQATDSEVPEGFLVKFHRDKVSEFPAVRNSLIALLDLEYVEGKRGIYEIYHSILFY